MTEPTEMRQKATALSGAFQEAFDFIYARDPDIAISILPTTFILCYQKLPPDLRLRVMHTTLTLAEDIGNEIFEDGSDFVSFLTSIKKYGCKKEDKND